MNIKERVKKFFRNIANTYDAIKTVNKKISEDFKDLFQYNMHSIDNIVYQSNGIVGLCDDVSYAGKTNFNKINTIREDFNKLENILFTGSSNYISPFSRQKNSINDSGVNLASSVDVISSQDAVEKIATSSRLKSAFISTIVGIGTMNYTYDYLRGKVINSQKSVLSPEKFNDVIKLKNKYFWKTDSQLQDIVQKETHINVNDFYSLIKDAMDLKLNNSAYSGIARINYDSRIASQDMKKDFIRAYYSSNKTLKDISIDFEKKYGMYISTSTISNNARKYFSVQGLDFRNRKEVKNYYSTHNLSIV